jgi:uncharacterized coiled-coil protein SlyX
MNSEAFPHVYEISPRFRHSLQERVARLERDAASDEQAISLLRDADHIRRHRRLVAVQRNEASRMQAFLDRSIDRLPRPLIAL